MLLRPLTFGVLTALCLASGFGARAADLDDYGYADAPMPGPAAETKVQFGSGWYVRGDLGVTRLPALSLAAPASDSDVPRIAFGNGSRVGYDASLGAGYAFNRFFRGDIVADFHEPISVRQYGNFYPAATSTCQIAQNTNTLSGTVNRYFENCSSNYQSSIHSYDVLINGYVDIGHWGLFTPYVGAGAGLAFGTFRSSVSYSQQDGTHYDIYFTDTGINTTFHGYRDLTQSGNYYNFAFALMAGVSVDVYDHTKLDIGYRYLNLGQVLGAKLQYHEARAGLRYMIDN